MLGGSKLLREPEAGCMPSVLPPLSAHWRPHAPHLHGPTQACLTCMNAQLPSLRMLLAPQDFWLLGYEGEGKLGEHEADAFPGLAQVRAHVIEFMQVCWVGWWVGGVWGAMLCMICCGRWRRCPRA